MQFRGLQCKNSIFTTTRMTASKRPAARQLVTLATTAAVLLLLLVATVPGAAAKHLQSATGGEPGHHRSGHHHRRSAGDEAGASGNGGGACEGYFGKLNVTFAHKHGNPSGPICGGHCCDAATEQELSSTSSNQFANNLRIHTQNLRRILEKTAETFKGHLIQLTYASENKTLTVFTQVYRRMSPLSRHPIVELYQQIRNHINGRNDFDFDTLVTKFFTTLFPVAYHGAVHSTAAADSGESAAGGAAVAVSATPAGDFHGDYKNCLRHTYEELQPFGSIPKQLAASLQHSLSAANVFVTALERAADILVSTEDITADALSSKCRQHLLKMTYCSKCNGVEAPLAKSCYGYCTNVLRGCLAEYVGVLDSPWSKVAESIDQMWRNSMETDNGPEEVLKTLDSKLSSAIMHTMENAKELEKKVKKACGNPTLLPTDGEDASRSTQSAPSGHHHVYKPMTPPANTEMLAFLVDIYKSKDFYSNIVDRICEEDDFEQRVDAQCWTGDSVGQYKKNVVSMGVDKQPYNPEVPLETDQYGRSMLLNELVDKLIKLRHTIEKPMMKSIGYSDVQSDMGDDSIGDGGSGYRYDNDDEEYGINVGSGDGSGSGPAPNTTPNILDTEERTIAPAAASSLSVATPLLALLALATIVAPAVRH